MTAVEVAIAIISLSALMLLMVLAPVLLYSKLNPRRASMAALNPAVIPAAIGVPVARTTPIHDTGRTPLPLDSGPRLPEEVVIDCSWHVSYFGGWCAPPTYRRRMRVRGVAARGGMHAAMGQEGQDAIGAAWDPATGRLFLAVADGLGSLPDSGAVAYNAVHAALYLWASRTDERPLREVGDLLFRRVAQGLEASFGAKVAERGGTTLVVAELIPDERGAAVTVQGVGDSEAWLLENDYWAPMHHERAEDFEPDDNVTRDLPTDPRPRTRDGRVPLGGVLVLATDGYAWQINPGPAVPGGPAERLRWTPAPIDLAGAVVGPEDAYSDDAGVVAVWVD